MEIILLVVIILGFYYTLDALIKTYNVVVKIYKMMRDNKNG